MNQLRNILSNFFSSVGVDYEQLNAIVRIKLKTDNRRQHITNRKSQKREPQYAFLINIFLHGLFGIFVAFIIFAIESFILSMILFYSYLIVLIAMTLITDFSTILLDTSDNTIILPRPVSGRTLFAARLTHIMLYLGQLTIGLSIAPAIAVFVKYGGPLLTAFLFLAVLSVLLAVFLTNAVYLLILQFANEEKLRNIINYFQIGMAIAMMAGYQILPRTMNFIGAQSVVFELKWWYFFAPPVWMAATLESLYLLQFDLPHIAMAICAISIPPAGLYFVNKYLTPVFNRKLGVMAVQQDKPRRRFGNGYYLKATQWITSKGEERAAYNMIFKILTRDRKIKLKIYPTVGYILVFCVIFLFKGQQPFNTPYENPADSRYYIALFYLTFMVLQVALHELPYSDDFKAGWIFLSAPFKNPGEILSGMVKAIMTRFFIPGYTLVTIVVLYIWGVDKIGSIVFGAINNYLMLMILVTTTAHRLPLTMPHDVRNQSGNIVRTFLTFATAGLLVAGHFLLSYKPMWMLTLIPVQIIFAFFLHRAYKRLTWSEITL